MLDSETRPATTNTGVGEKKSLSGETRLASVASHRNLCRCLCLYASFPTAAATHRTFSGGGIPMLIVGSWGEDKGEEVGGRVEKERKTVQRMPHEAVKGLHPARSTSAERSDGWVGGEEGRTRGT